MGKRQQLSVNCALKKCPRHACTQEDRISQLPDDILVHVLAFLSIKEATYTSVLSKRWLHLWKYIPRLDFDATEPLYQVYLNHKLRKRHMKKYVRWVNHTLNKCKVLLLKSVNVTGEVLEFFLHNCPFLEEMVVHGSGTLVNLQVIGPSLKLKHLEIWYCHCLESLKIHDTNLVTLVASGANKLLLYNAPMLIKVEIVGAFRPILNDILSCVLSQLEVLKITATGGLEYFGHYKSLEFTKLKKFVIWVYAWEDKSLLGCTNVIEAAPLLEEFELKLLWFKPLRLKRVYMKIVGCPLHHLKVIRMCGYFGRTCEFELVKYFLENAIVLEKIIIDPHSQNVSHVLSPSTIEKEQMSRNFAKLQLEGEVPPHIELVIL